jgi:hypothetical protein
MNEWDKCEHEWAFSNKWEDDDNPRAVVCKKCGCPGEKQSDNSIFWPAT